MAPTKSIDKTNALKGAIPEPDNLDVRPRSRCGKPGDRHTPFGRFQRDALGEHRGVLQLGLLLIPFATLVVWSSATVLYLVFRAVGLLGTLKRLIGHARSKASGMWDDWLDIPEPHHR